MNSSLNRPSKPPEPLSPKAPEQIDKMTPELAVPPNPPKPVDENSIDGSPTDASSDFSLESGRHQPIPPPSESMQYRAIGLIRGRYTSSSEQFTKGNLVSSDGTVIDAVLLGRVMSLVKKHLDLEQEHLWVVYPRTRESDPVLHAQIVGVWEPEKLNKADQDASIPLGEAPETSAGLAEPNPTPEFEDGYFSIRGEVIYYSPEDRQAVVKIRQAPRKDASQEKAQEKAFKLHLHGTLVGKVLGHFWELNVQRQGDKLVIQEGRVIGIMPPRKKPPQQRREFRKGDYTPKRNWEASRPSRPKTGAPSSPAAPPTRKTPLPKPVKRIRTDESKGA
ncbi:MAG: hypothetical protein VKJ46_00865 [Leptolyngbyaceae bacterium]|nr:hypothetical protein [Leptolyngbyaceae bacterium]